MKASEDPVVGPAVARPGPVSAALLLASLATACDARFDVAATRSPERAFTVPPVSIAAAESTDAPVEIEIEPATPSSVEAKMLPPPRPTRPDFTTALDPVLTSTRDLAGISLAGTTGAESRYMLEDANITHPSFGTIGTTIESEFVAEIDVVESGYPAEHGGAAGGQIAAKRVSGSNKRRGVVGTRVTPRLVAPRLIGASDEALRATEISDLEAQVFALVSGPIVKDHLFFTIGVASSGARSHLTQSFYRIEPDAPADKFAEQRFATGWLNLSSVVGLDWRIRPRHQLRLTGFGGPEFRRTPYRLPHGPEPNAFGNPRIDPLGGTSRAAMGVVNDHFGTGLAHTTVVALDYSGRVLDDDADIEASIGFSQFGSEDAWRLDDPSQREITATQWHSDTGLDLRAQLERDGALDLVPGVQEACEGEAGEVVCPVSTWLSGGLGEYDRDLARRVSARLGMTHYFSAMGSHRLGYGGAVDWTQRRSLFRYSGANDPDFYDSDRCDAGQRVGGEYCFDPSTASYEVDNDIRVNANRLILVDGDNPDQRLTWGFGRARHELGQREAITNERGQGVRAAAYDETVSSLDYAVYLQDRWALTPDLLVLGGVRWELQDLRDIYGQSQVLIWDNIAPRIGVVYDWTRESRSRLYFHYGHYYQPMPLQLNSRVFGGLINVARGYSASDCEGQSTGEQPSEWCVDRHVRTAGAYGGAVVPRLRGQFNRQMQMGYEQEVVEDLVIGVRWLHSALGRAIEDVSPNGGYDSILANPGVGVDDRHIAAQRSQCEAIAAEIAALDELGEDDERKTARELARCEFLVSAYEAVDSLFAKPTRNFDAWTLHLQKRFTKNWVLIARYTYSRLVGNYDGYVDPLTGVINIGASTQYDDPELIRNSFGPLAYSVPHRLYLDGLYTFDLRSSGALTLAASVRAQSGVPVSLRVGSTVPAYRGAPVNYLLPRGAGGRVAPNYQLNLFISYTYPLAHAVDLELGVRLLNVTNAKATLRVDEVYSHDVAKPIAGGDLDDLAHAKRGEAGFFARDLVRPQANFGVATQLQQPLSAQFELKLRF